MDKLVRPTAQTEDRPQNDYVPGIGR